MVLARNLEAPSAFFQEFASLRDLCALRACPVYPEPRRRERSRGVSALDFSSSDLFPTLHLPFRGNTYKMSCKCSFQKTYTKAKSFKMRTYKNRGVGTHFSSRPFLISLLRCFIASTSVVVPLECRCITMGNSFYLFSLPIVTGLFLPQQRGVHPSPSLQ